MKFDLSDFLELDTKALLAVNGGASCSGGSCGYQCSSVLICGYHYSHKKKPAFDLIQVQVFLYRF